MSEKVMPGQGLGRGRGRAPTFDHDEAEGLYRELGWSVARIATFYGVADMTIYRMLKARGVELHWSRKKVTCRNGHARVVWGYKSGDKQRCRRCDRGGQAARVYLVVVADLPAGIFSTLELAIRACPDSLVWGEVVSDELWSAIDSEYTIQAFWMDPAARNNAKL